ncbi:MAG: hypothetical protein WC784_01040 [Candidatus Shapirobacteria bacterium]|jgi:hypothetical protein
MKNQVTYDDVSKLIDSKLEVFTEKLDEKLLNWKSEVIDTVDSVAREMNTNQEFREIVEDQIEEHKEKIMRLEKKVFGSVSA